MRKRSKFAILTLPFLIGGCEQASDGFTTAGTIDDIRRADVAQIRDIVKDYKKEEKPTCDKPEDFSKPDCRFVPTQTAAAQPTHSSGGGGHFFFFMNSFSSGPGYVPSSSYSSSYAPRPVQRSTYSSLYTNKPAYRAVPQLARGVNFAPTVAKPASVVSRPSVPSIPNSAIATQSRGGFGSTGAAFAAKAGGVSSGG